ncbi:flavin reductase family protein [Methylobacterium nigriterrae]|uniref:flavin reductase family protein n=1 Tax=Methylobacterium nigriterrae TaxID=3127512 RepID=UPI003013E8E3
MAMPSAARISNEEFKPVMRRFAACVNVITSVDGETKNGMTATAVCSVSADPPSVLIIVNKSSRSHALISRSQAFGVNVLSSEQEDIASHFASKSADPFAEIDHWIGRTGCPIICDADAYLECSVVKETDFGTHTIFIGQIVSCDVSSKPPLLYHEGRFCGLQQAQLEYA